MTSRLAWFSTESGKSFVFGSTCVTGIGLFFCNYLPHTLLLEKYKDIIQMYRNGLGVPVPEKVMQRATTVMDDLKMTPVEQKLIKFFTVFGYDVFHAGSTMTTSGALVGIPSSFNYSSVDDVEKRHILVNREQVPWSTKHGQDLLDALVLSEYAQKFAIAGQISHTRTPQLYLNTAYPTGVLVIMYSVGYNLNRKLDFFSRPLSLRMVLYSILGLFGYGLMAFLKDYTTVYFEGNSDKKACDLGEDYIKGGVEFYNKVLKRNVALFNLMDSQGAKYYTATGNEQVFLRQKHLPITFRKDYVQSRLTEVQKTPDKTKSS